MGRAPSTAVRIDGAQLLLTLLGTGDAVPVVDAASWRAASAAAAWRGLRPALQHAVAVRGLADAPPPDVRRALADARAVAELRATARAEQLREILDALRDVGVCTLVLKGAYLAEHVWPTPALRPMSDIDLLARVADHERALEVLSSLGYAPGARAVPTFRHAAALCRAGRIPVDLHHTLDPCLPPFALPPDALWERARPCTVAGVPACALGPEDLLLHIATHMGYSHLLGTSLVSVCDVRAWVERFGPSADWDAIVARARAAGVRRFVYAALALAERALDAEVPRAPMAALRSPADDVVVEGALALLAAPPFVVVGAQAVTDPNDTPPRRVARVARALLLSPLRESLGPALPAHTAERTLGAPARDGFVARWSALARLVLQPAAGRAAMRQVAHVRALRRWAAEPG